MEHQWRRESVLLPALVKSAESASLKVVIDHAPFEQDDFLPIRSELARLNVATILVRSLMYGSSLKGVLVIFSEGTSRTWSAQELELIDSVAGQVAIAIEHAELVSKLSSSNDDLVHKNENLDAKNLEPVSYTHLTLPTNREG